MTDKDRFQSLASIQQQLMLLRDTLGQSSNGCSCGWAIGGEVGLCAHHAYVHAQIEEAEARLSSARLQLQFPNGVHGKAQF